MGVLHQCTPGPPIVYLATIGPESGPVWASEHCEYQTEWPWLNLRIACTIWSMGTYAWVD